MGLSDLKRWFKQEADIYYLSTSSDGKGGFDKEWVRKYSKEPCRVIGCSGRLTIVEAGVNYPVTSEMLCDPEVEIEKGDKVLVDDKQYLVLKTNKPSAYDSGAHHTVVSLGQMEGEYGFGQ
jgi:hypothetical protein